MRSPLILGLSMVLCIPVAYSHAKSSNIVNNESVQSILQGRTINHCIYNQLLLNNLQVISQKYGRNL